VFLTEDNISLVQAKSYNNDGKVAFKILVFMTIDFPDKSKKVDIETENFRTSGSNSCRKHHVECPKTKNDLTSNPIPKTLVRIYKFS
jgi:hypothetical protein